MAEDNFNNPFALDDEQFIEWKKRFGTGSEAKTGENSGWSETNQRTDKETQEQTNTTKDETRFVAQNPWDVAYVPEVDRSTIESNTTTIRDLLAKREQRENDIKGYAQSQADKERKRSKYLAWTQFLNALGQVAGMGKAPVSKPDDTRTLESFKKLDAYNSLVVNPYNDPTLQQLDKSLYSAYEKNAANMLKYSQLLNRQQQENTKRVNDMRKATAGQTTTVSGSTDKNRNSTTTGESYTKYKYEGENSYNKTYNNSQVEYINKDGQLALGNSKDLFAFYRYDEYADGFYPNVKNTPVYVDANQAAGVIDRFNSAVAEYNRLPESDRANKDIIIVTGKDVLGNDMVVTVNKDKLKSELSDIEKILASINAASFADGTSKEKMREVLSRINYITDGGMYRYFGNASENIDYGNNYGVQQSQNPSVENNGTENDGDSSEDTEDDYFSKLSSILRDTTIRKDDVGTFVAKIKEAGISPSLNDIYLASEGSGLPLSTKDAIVDALGIVPDSLNAPVKPRWDDYKTPKPTADSLAKLANK